MKQKRRNKTTPATAAVAVRDRDGEKDEKKSEKKTHKHERKDETKAPDHY